MNASSLALHAAQMHAASAASSVQSTEISMFGCFVTALIFYAILFGLLYKAGCLTDLKDSKD